MSRDLLNKLSRDELMDRLVLVEERERRANERRWLATWTIETAWVGAPGDSSIVIPHRDIGHLFCTELIESYARTSPLEERYDGWDGPFVKAVTVNYRNGGAGGNLVVDKWMEEAL